MKLCVRYAHTHQGPRCVRSMLPPGWSPVGYCLGSCHGYLWRGQPSALKAGRASHERSSLRNGAEARRGKTYSAENKQVHHVLHGYKFRRGEGSGGAPQSFPARGNLYPVPCLVPPSGEGKSGSRRFGGGLGSKPVLWLLQRSSTLSCRGKTSWGMGSGWRTGTTREAEKLPQKMQDGEETAVGTPSPHTH